MSIHKSPIFEHQKLAWPHCREIHFSLRSVQRQGRDPDPHGKSVCFTHTYRLPSTGQLAYSPDHYSCGRSGVSVVSVAFVRVKGVADFDYVLQLPYLYP